MPHLALHPLTAMRKLTLKKETLAELSTAELADVVGAAPTLKTCGPTVSMTCTSEIDRCLTARGCPITMDVC